MQLLLPFLHFGLRLLSVGLSVDRWSAARGQLDGRVGVDRLTGGGTALLIAEQNVAFLPLATRGFLIDHGRVKLSGPRAVLESDNAVREAYFGL